MELSDDPVEFMRHVRHIRRKKTSDPTPFLLVGQDSSSRPRKRRRTLEGSMEASPQILSPRQAAIAAADELSLLLGGGGGSGAAKAEEEIERNRSYYRIRRRRTSRWPRRGGGEEEIELAEFPTSRCPFSPPLPPSVSAPPTARAAR